MSCTKVQDDVVVLNGQLDSEPTWSQVDQNEVKSLSEQFSVGDFSFEILVPEIYLLGCDGEGVFVNNTVLPLSETTAYYGPSRTLAQDCTWYDIRSNKVQERDLRAGWLLRFAHIQEESDLLNFASEFYKPGCEIETELSDLDAWGFYQVGVYLTEEEKQKESPECFGWGAYDFRWYPDLQKAVYWSLGQAPIFYSDSTTSFDQEIANSFEFIEN